MDQAPRTKRKYTVSGKVRAANRLNLEKARAVGKEILYRPTQKRRNACRANLLIARQSPNFKPNVRHGLRAVDLRESALQVGETQEDYDRHMELVEGVLPAWDRRERNGVQGLGQALWRRRRLFGSRAHRETLGFYLELEKAAVDGLCPASVRDLSFSSRHLFAGGADPRLEQTMDRLDQRLARVGEAYLSEYALELVSLGVEDKQCYSVEFLDEPPEAIGNVLLGAGEVVRRMENSRKREMKGADWFDWDLKLHDMKSGLLKEWARLGNRVPDARREKDFALHLRLIEAAFFGDRDAGFSLEKGKGRKETGQEDDSPLSSEEEASHFQFRASDLDGRVAEFKAAFPKTYQAVWKLAQATWQRLQVFARQAQKEAQELRKKLERAAGGTLEPGEKSLKELWQEARNRRWAQLPRDPIDEVLWAKCLQAVEKAMAKKQGTEVEKQKAEGRNQNSEARSRESEDGDASETAESKIQNLKSKITESSIAELDPQWTVEQVIGVFLCGEAYLAFKSAEQCNRRVEEAFAALERALQDVLPPLDGDATLGIEPSG
jgi:hypothetical protein